MSADTRLASPLSRLHGATHPFVRVVSLASRFLLHGWCASVHVRGLDRLTSVLQDKERVRRRQGVLTYANHISVLDDPTLFGSLPKEAFKHALTTRWTLGASDIMFTNPMTKYIFRSGQVLSTDRGRGVFQPALDQSIDLLNNGGWVHVFPEGYVNMSRKSRVRRFKWGVGRMILEAGSQLTEAADENSPLTADVSPVVLPIWIKGFDAMMPEPRNHPRWLPRPGAHVSITFGHPINGMLDPLVHKLRGFAMMDTSKKQGGPSSATATEQLQAELKQHIADLSTLSSKYPVPSPSLFPPPTPLQVPEDGGVQWSIHPNDSRSARSINAGLDSDRSRIARSFLAAELRAHLLNVGKESGESTALVHRLMKGDES